MGTGIVAIGATFVDIKGYPHARYIPAGRNAGRVIETHGGVSRNIAEDIANVGLNPTFLSVVDHSGTSNDIIERLRRHGCNTDYIRRTEDGLGMWLAVFDHTGDLVASISRRPSLEELSVALDEFGRDLPASGRVPAAVDCAAAATSAAAYDRCRRVGAVDVDGAVRDVRVLVALERLAEVDEPVERVDEPAERLAAQRLAVLQFLDYNRFCHVEVQEVWADGLPEDSVSLPS